MALFDMSLEELWQYKPDVEEPADFDAFWHDTLAAAREYPLNARFEAVDYGLRLVDSYDVSFVGYAGQTVQGWFLLPKERQGPLPCVVEYIGYSGGRGLGFENLLWANMGFAYLLMDTRGQGSSTRQGGTADLPVDGANPFVPGFMTQGILDPQTYYYRRLFTDAARAVDAAMSHDVVDSNRVAATGGSQGGGITLAAGALNDNVKVIMPDVPFLCHYRRATNLTDRAPYSEIVRYLALYRDQVDIVFKTLSFFDGVNFAKRITAQALFSVGLMDQICPPSTVFAAYNHLRSEKEMRVYPYNEHEGGGNQQMLEKTRFLQTLWL